MDVAAIIAATPELLLRRDLCAAAADPEYTVGDPPVYIPADEYEAARVRLNDPGKALPLACDHLDDFFSIKARHGLLYLPFPYLVPGGRFNSMYGWDSAFAVFAWAASHPLLMRWQVDNHLYQVRRYGKVLNANRTYHLSRSQPPLLAAMVLSVYRAARERNWRDFDPEGLYGTADGWLRQARPVLESYYGYWTGGERLVAGGPLSRYWDEAEVPAPEVVVGEPGHFEHARDRFAREGDDGGDFYDPASDSLTPLYYRADRAMRASGFDPTGHWGYGGLRCLFHAPVCLNSLLYRMEGDLADISDLLGEAGAAGEWRVRQHNRKAAMDRLMLNPDQGTYEDHDSVRRRRNDKPFANFFHALWAGLYDGLPALAEQAAASALSHLETPYGIVTSLEESGSQWDFPYGWPPLQYLAFAGLQRCGLDTAARRIAGKYDALAERVFAGSGALFEKYNMRDGNAEVRVVHGYSENTSENGTFLWTAATLKLARDCLSGQRVW